MRHAIKSLTLAVLLLGSGGTASAVTYVFDYATPFLGGTRIPLGVIMARSYGLKGGTSHSISSTTPISRRSSPRTLACHTRASNSAGPR